MKQSKIRRWKVLAAALGLSASLMGPSLTPGAFADATQSTYYVDAVNGSDANPGSQAQPLKTLAKAAAFATSNQHQGIGSTIVMQPGLYREGNIRLTGSVSSPVPLTLQAATPGTVVITGAERWSGWQPLGGSSTLYTHGWPYTWGDCPIPDGWPAFPKITGRREMVFVNDTLLTQVLDQSQMSVGTYYVDETNSRIYLWPPTGTDITTADIEVPVHDALLTIQNWNNVTLQNLTFQHSNACMGTQNAVAIDTSTNLLVDTVQTLWNNAVGIAVTHQNQSTIRNVTAQHNGQMGVSVYYAKNTLFENIDISYNNWRGALGSYYDWAVAGSKMFYVTNSTLNSIRAFGNEGPGLWLDTGQSTVTVKTSQLSHNLGLGFNTEANPGPLLFQDNTVCNNALGGMGGENTENFTVSNNIFYNNGFLNNAAAITAWSKGSRPVTDQELGQAYALDVVNWTLTRNVIVNAANSLIGVNMPTADLGRFVNSLRSDQNTWYNTMANGAPFVLYHQDNASASSYDTFSHWQSDTGQDASSIYGAPAGNFNAGCNQGMPITADDFTLTTYPSALDTVPNVTVGTAVPFTIGMIPKGSFSGTVALSVKGLSSSVRGTFNTAFVGPYGSSTLTVTPSASTPNGLYTFIVSGLSGTITKTATLTLNVKGNSTTLNPDQPLSVTVTPIALTRVYPNPWRADRGNPNVTFDQMPPNSTVKIFTISGHWVTTLNAPLGSVVWPVVNSSHDRVASGIYLCLIADADGHTTQQKLVIIK